MRTTARRRLATRPVAVLTAALFVVAIFQPSARAAGATWYRVGSPAGVGAYDLMGDSPTGESTSTGVNHGERTGAFLFVPRALSSTATSGPGQTAAGRGYATAAALEGTIASGTWRFTGSITTDVPTGVVEGHVLVAMYAVGAGGSRLVGVAQDGRNLLASAGTRSFDLSVSLPTITLNNEHLATEWYLVVTDNDAPDGNWTTRLRHGTSGDAVVAPNPLVPPPLGAPSQLVVSSVGDNQISLSWAPSRDARADEYLVRRATSSTGPWTDVAAVSATTFTDRGLDNGTRYYHTVVARSSSGERSSPTNATSAVPADSSAPATPGDPTVTPDGSGELIVTWRASTTSDVVAYNVQRSGSPSGPYANIAQVSGTSYSDDSLAANSMWHYRIVAVDDDGLTSAPSAPGAGTVAPSPPSGLRVVGVASGAVALAWNGTNERVAGYVIERASSSGGSYSQVAGPIGGTSFTDSGLTNGVTYWYRIRAVDSAGSRSSSSGSVSAVPRDTGRPAPPTFLVKDPMGTRVQLQWGASPSSSVAGYRVLRSTQAGGPFADVSGLIRSTSFIDGPLVVAMPYYYVVVAEDAAGNRSIESTQERYTVPPSAPTGLVAVEVSESTAKLRWNSTGEPVAGYLVSRSESGGPFLALGRVSGTEFVDGGLRLGRTYRYVVQAEARDGTLSSPSNDIVVVPRDGPPTSPSGVQVVDTTAGGQLRITWAANAEPDVVSYVIERATSSGAWTRIATIGTTTYLDGGLTDGVTYRYRVLAIDRVGFSSDASQEDSGVPSDRTAPPAPSGVVARSWPSYVDVAWSQSPGAVAYVLLRATQSSGPYTPVSGVLTGRTFRDTQVTPGTTYFYVVHARDAAGNESGPSPEVRTLFSGPGSGGTTGTTGTTTTGGDTGGSDGGSTGTTGVPPTTGTTGTTGGGSTGDFPVPFPTGPVAGGPTDPPTDEPTDEPEPGESEDPDDDGDPGPIAIGEIPIPGDQPDIPEGTDADDALASGDISGSIAESAQEVAENVGEVVRVFRLPLLVLALLLVYLIVQGRLGREPLPMTADVPTGADDDDVEYLL